MQVLKQIQSLTDIISPKPEDFEFLNYSGRKIYYDQGFYGQDVIVAVIDTGIINHKEFLDETGKSRILQGKCTNGYYADVNKTTDDHGHGSHVSGTIGGKTCGIAPKVRILPFKALDNMGCCDEQDVIDALNYAKNYVSPDGKRVDIINMSLGFPQSLENNTIIFNAFHQAIIDCVNSGISVICAAGNSGKEERLYPGYFNEVIEVGAVDVNKKVAYFTTQNNQVDICQIGVDVLSCSLSGNYVKMSGTSMATPHIAGIAALIISKYKAQNKKYMPDEVLYEILRLNTIDLDIAGVDKITGAGFCTLNPKYKKIRVDFKQGDCNIYVNGQLVVSDVPVTVQLPPNSTAGRTMIPLRIFSENLGMQVLYDNTTKVASIIQEY